MLPPLLPRLLAAASVASVLLVCVWRRRRRGITAEATGGRQQQAELRRTLSVEAIAFSKKYAKLWQQRVSGGNGDGRTLPGRLGSEPVPPRPRLSQPSKSIHDGDVVPVQRTHSAPSEMQTAAPLELSVRCEEAIEPSDALDQDGHLHSVIGMSVMTIGREALVPGTPLTALVEAMDRWRTEFVEQRRGDAAADHFWHRKSKKIVLAVVALNVPGTAQLTFVRACNLEVSMPSGSLCAERNAIGTALSMYPTAHRKDFRGVAVLSLTSGEDNLNPLPPCGVCSEWLEKIVEVARPLTTTPSQTQTYPPRLT